MSLKLVPFERLGAVTYSLSVVTVAVSVAVCEIFSVKEWRGSHSRSLKLVPLSMTSCMICLTHISRS